ncbi:MAG: hypothetical protein HLX51_09565 [Micrococcaceae bacterium]|nr:hypothetical protein [Micrococcaceae bacterium]
MVEPVQLGRGAAFAAGAASGSVQRKLRKMSERPEDPRVFSQAKILVSLGLPLSVIMTATMYFPISEYVQGSSDDVFSVIIPGLITLACYTLLAHGLFRRFGVDHEKVWTRFGKLFYRQVRFEDIDRFDVGNQRYKLYAGDTKVNVDYNRFDYSLVYIQLLEELQHRRFKIQAVNVDDPEWEDTAQVHRNMFASDVYENHQAFYEAHPQELERLQRLVQPPRTYKS